MTRVGSGVEHDQENEGKVIVATVWMALGGEAVVLTTMAAAAVRWVRRPAMTSAGQVEQLG